MSTFTLSPEREQALIAAAARANLSPDELLNQLIDVHVSGPAIPRISLSQPSVDALFPYLVENIQDVLFIKDTDDTRVVYVSPAFERLLGYPREDLFSGRRFFIDLVHPDDKERVAVQFDRQRQGEVVSFEARMIRPDGELRHVEYESFPLSINEAGGLVVGIIKDVTHKKDLQAALEMSSLMLDQIPDGILMTDLEGNILRWEANAEAVFGYSAEEAIGRHVSFLHAPELRATKTGEMVSDLESAGEYLGAFPCIRKDGKRIWIEVHSHLIHDLDGHPIGYIGTNTDVTRLQQVQQELLEAKAALEQQIARRSHELDTLINVMPDYIFQIERDDYRITYCNDNFARVIGYANRFAVQGRTVRECFPPDQAEYFIAQNDDVFISGESVRIAETLQLPAGLRHVDTYKIPLFSGDGSVYALLGTARDVTEIMEARQELSLRQQELEVLNARLSESEARYRAISELSMDYAYSYALLETGEIYTEWITAAFTRLTGYELSETHSLEEHYRLIYPEDLPIYQQQIEKLKTEAMRTRLEVRLIINSGQIIHTLKHFESIWDESQQRVTHIIGVVQDITALKQAELELLQERDFLRKLMQTSPAGIMVVDADNRVTFSNQRLRDILGMNHEEIVALRAAGTWPLMDPLGQPLEVQKTPFYRVMAAQGSIFNMEIAFRRPDATIIYLSINGAPLTDEKDRIQQVIFHVDDISLRMKWEREIEEALIRERQLNELRSRFVSLITHELRTPLAIIMTSTDIIQRRHHMLSDEQMASRIKQIQAQISRLAAIMEDVTVLNRDDTVGYHLQPEQIDALRFCRDVIDELMILRKEQGPALHLHHELPNITLRTDQVLFHRILVNLISNSIKYTPEEGEIHVTCSEAEGELVVEVRDTGVGVPEKEQAQLFNQFYRASNVTNIVGTGMGLVITKRAVELLQGSIDFSSVEGQGTTFRVRLPDLN